MAAKKVVSFDQGNDEVMHLELRASSTATTEHGGTMGSSRRSSSSSSQDASGMDDALRVAAAAKALVLTMSPPQDGSSLVQRLLVSPTAARPAGVFPFDDAECSFRSSQEAAASSVMAHHAVQRSYCHTASSRGRMKGRNATGGHMPDLLLHTAQPAFDGACGDADVGAGPPLPYSSAGLDLSIESYAVQSGSASKWQATSFCSQGTVVEHNGGTPSTEVTPVRKLLLRDTAEQYASAVQIAKDHQLRSLRELLREGCRRTLLLDDDDVM